MTPKKEIKRHGYIMYQMTVSLLLGSLAYLTSCGDLTNDPEPQTSPPQVEPKKPEEKKTETPPDVEPKKPDGKKSETPKTPKTPQEPLNPEQPQEPSIPPEPYKPTVTKPNEMCEVERQWAYTSGQIDASQLRLFRNRNLAPVYIVPGQRQSGIESWFVCEKALRMNGFIR